jgi:hypothetical protein
MSAIKRLIAEVEHQRPQRINGALTDEAAAELARLEAIEKACKEFLKTEAAQDLLYLAAAMKPVQE